VFERFLQVPLWDFYTIGHSGWIVSSPAHAMQHTVSAASTAAAVQNRMEEKFQEVVPMDADADVDLIVDVMKNRIVDVFGLSNTISIIDYFLTHYHHDHAAYEFKNQNPKAIKAHFSQSRTLAAMELFASPVIIAHYRRLGLTAMWNENVRRVEVPHPDVNNGKHGFTGKSTSYRAGRLLWIAETDAQNLLHNDKLQTEIRKADAVAVPPPDPAHYLGGDAVNECVQMLQDDDKVVFTYAHAFPNTEKWQRIARTIDSKTGIGRSRVPPVGLLVIPQVIRSFQDVSGGRYTQPTR